VNPFWVVVAGVIIGATKAAVTVSLIALLVPNPEYFGALPSRAFGSAVTGAWLLPVSALFLATRERFQAERELLLRETFAQNHPNPPVSLDSGNVVSVVVAEVAEFTSKALRDLEARRENLEQLSNYLRKVLQRNLRALTRQLVTEPSRRFTDFSAKDLIATTIRTKNYPIGWIVLAHLGATAPFVFFQTGLSETLGRAAVSTFLLAGTLILVKRGVGHGLQSEVVTLATGLTLWSFFNELVNNLLFGVFGSSTPVFTGLANALLAFGLAVVLGALRVAVADRQEIRDLLEQLLGEKYWKQSVATRASMGHRRLIAQALHGRVQNTLLATITKLDTHGATADVNELTQALSDLSSKLSEASLHTSEHHPTLDEAMAALRARWEGVIDVRYSLHGPHALLTSSAMQTVVDVAEEAISNSTRHGMATVVDINITASTSSVSLEAIDNGVGPRRGSPGLGNAMFSELSSDWTIQSRDDSTGSKLFIRWG
jgi:signal transduction histidine kinase